MLFLQKQRKGIIIIGAYSDLNFCRSFAKILFRNGELNLLWPDIGCPLQAGTGHGLPELAPGRSLLHSYCGGAVC